MSNDKLTEEQLVDVLREANLISVRQLERAREKQQRTGYTLREILLPQVPWGRIRRMLENEITRPGGGNAPLGEVLAENGWITRAQLDEVRREEAGTGAAIGKILVERGAVTSQQLGEAHAYRERTGVSLWRTFINLELATAKQVAEAFRTYNEYPFVYRSDDRLADLLLRNNVLRETEVNDLRARAEAGGVTLVKVLVDSGRLKPDRLAGVLSELFGIPTVDLEKEDLDDETLAAIPAEVVIKHQAVPFARQDDLIRLALSDPTRLPTLQRVGTMVGLRFEPYLSAPEDIRKVIEKRVMQPVERGPVEIAHAALLLSAQDDVLTGVSGDASVSALTHAIVLGAYNADATDVHLETHEKGMRIRYRIDGILHDVLDVPPSTGLAIISRLKVMSNLDIVERRRPQDGHLTFEADGRSLDMRISTVPGYLGEAVVLRIINEETVVQGLSQLGLEPQQHSLIDTLMAKPYGMFLAAGPVGSGKTTTIYSCVNQINILEWNVMTIEDPVEYRLKGTNQLQVDYRRGFDFVTGLRAILRQDPDIIVVGEVRDEETAKIAVRAALMGVLVLTTIHGNDAASTVSSLYQYSIPGFLISNAVIGVVAQRLVRRICPHCRQEYRPSPEIYRQLGIDPEKGRQPSLYRGIGCTRCFHTGYSGRTGVFEVMETSDELRELVFRETTKEAIQRLAVEQGMQTLAESGRQKVLRGETTVDEFFRVIFV